ncbi:hypothetical protein [Amycolatopsis xylanica]|uniref:hypothetical protein n=1 Tax=Amycolatopsis xylanica TaxID=589385 RepID=UPI00115FB3A5|nr:hypothetical protein [Amycolatopsis xylanica]
MRELFEVGPDSLERFLSRWHGPADRERAVVEHDLPRPLREWFELTSCWTALDDTQNVVLKTPRLEDGKLVFWLENQGVWAWAVDPVGDDPPVHDRENAVGVPWQPTGVPLSTFLLHVAVFEAIMGSANAANVFGLSEVREILAPLRTLPAADWRWPAEGYRLYAGDSTLAFAGPEEAWVASQGS